MYYVCLRICFVVIVAMYVYEVHAVEVSDCTEEEPPENHILLLETALGSL